MQSIKPAGAEDLNHISIARQPIVDAGKNILAYELFNRTQPGTRHTVESDISMVLNAVANNGMPFTTAHSDLFVHALHAGLSGTHWDFLDPKKVVASVPPVPNHDAARIAELATALAALRARGFRLCFHHFVVAPVYKAWQPLADFVKLDLAAIPADKLAPLVAAIRARTPARCIAMKLESAEQFAALQAMQVTLFQGYWFSKPELVMPRVLAPTQMVAVELFNLLSQAAEMDAVEDALKKDAALGVNLLRLINSAAVGLGQKVTSIRQAVMLMGYDKLTKWVSLVLATAGFQASSLIKSSAIVRGRMMELLALEDSAAFDPGLAFLIGLLSQIGGLLGCDMATALKQLSLAESIVDVLLHDKGPYANLLALARACESEDDADFARAFSKLGYTLRQINIAQMEALAWTDAALS